MSNRKLSWTTALRDLKSDRAPRAAVRREILKTRAGGLPLCAWTGRSQRRYVFRVLPISAVDASDLRDMVVLGVDADGDIVGAFSSCAMPHVASMQTAGATEIHLHSQCDTLFERAAVAADLRRLSAEAA